MDKKEKYFLKKMLPFILQMKKTFLMGFGFILILGHPILTLL